MSKKVLFCATIIEHFHAFHLPYLKWFKEQGWEVHIAARGDMELPFVDEKYNITIQRSPFKSKNLQAYNQLKSIINQNEYQIIHCHTPMGGVLARLAARAARKRGTKVIYTAHGFHFCKGAPLLNWLMYYPIERFLAPLTDCLITINDEDFQLAKTHRFKAGLIRHVHGVGVNSNIYTPVDSIQKNVLRHTLGYKPNDFIMFYAAEFNQNKNQQLLIQSLARVKSDIPHAKLLLAGDGVLFEECQKLAASLGIEKMVDFLGYRHDIEFLLKMSDIAVASSLREGLPVNIMEAMSCGLPILATVNRGHKELVQNNLNGWLIDSTNIDEFGDKMRMLAENEANITMMGKASRSRIVEHYSLYSVLQEKCSIYREFMDEMEELKWAAH